MTEGFWIAYAIIWWVLAAVGAVSLITYAFVCFEYYRWDKEEREREKIFTEFCHCKIEDREHENKAEIIVDNDNNKE